MAEGGRPLSNRAPLRIVGWETPLSQASLDWLTDVARDVQANAWASRRYQWFTFLERLADHKALEVHLLDETLLPLAEAVPAPLPVFAADGTVVRTPR